VGVLITNPERAVLKRNTTIQLGTIINAMGGFYLGENSGIGPHTIIWTVNHSFRGAGALPFDNKAELKPVVIRENVWISAGVRILPGIEVGEGAIVGMGAVVMKDVPPLAIVMGNPATIIGHRNREDYYRLKEEGRFINRELAYEEYILPLTVQRRADVIGELGILPAESHRKDLGEV
jgi:acetyltransferase-like isoleucine patch superfamily enzyme